MGRVFGEVDNRIRQGSRINFLVTSAIRETCREVEIGDRWVSSSELALLFCRTGSCFSLEILLQLSSLPVRSLL
jgi:hypothetical protein